MRMKTKKMTRRRTIFKETTLPEWCQSELLWAQTCKAQSRLIHIMITMMVMMMKKMKMWNSFNFSFSSRKASIKTMTVALINTSRMTLKTNSGIRKRQVKVQQRLRSNRSKKMRTTTKEWQMKKRKSEIWSIRGKQQLLDSSLAAAADTSLLDKGRQSSSKSLPQALKSFSTSILRMMMKRTFSRSLHKISHEPKC